MAIGLLAVLAVPVAAGAGAPYGGRSGKAEDKLCAGFDAELEKAAAQSAEAARTGRSREFHRHQRCLKLNQFQVIGTHNSYKQPIAPPLLQVIAGQSAELALSLEYSHSPLPEQFSDEGVRQIEIDVYHDPEGGLLAGRPVLDVLGLPNETPPELLEPGFKVLHINDIDFNSSCLTFVACLTDVRRWSRANRDHLPIMILIELKTDPIPDPLNIGFVTPLPIGPAELDALDAEIRSVFKDRDTIDPEEIRGRHETLEDAVLAGDWPTLRRSKGKVMFTMVNGGAARDDYLDGHPSLDGRVMFTNSTPGQPDAAFVKVDDAISNLDRIQELVAAGYIVRTRSDIDTIEARTGDTTRLAAALASGAQWVSTDYPVPGRAFVDYTAAIPDGDPARCNPVNTGSRCNNALLERLRTKRR